MATVSEQGALSTTKMRIGWSERKIWGQMLMQNLMP